MYLYTFSVFIQLINAAHILAGVSEHYLCKCTPLLIEAACSKIAEGAYAAKISSCFISSAYMQHSGAYVLIEALINTCRYCAHIRQEVVFGS